MGNDVINWNCSIIPTFWDVNYPGSCAPTEMTYFNIQGDRHNSPPYDFEFKVTPRFDDDL